MHFVLIYASIEGQTRKIAQHIETLLKTNHHSLEMLCATDDESLPELIDVDGIIICAPVHTGSFPKSIYHLLKKEHSQLMAVPGAFVSVSMAVASNNTSDAAEIDKIVHTLSEETGWWPVVTHNAAGALKYIEYDFFKRWMMRRIAEKTGNPTDTSRDHEFTDWAKLDQFILQFVSDVPTLKNKI